MDIEQALMVYVNSGENLQEALDYLTKITEDSQNFPECADLFFRLQNDKARAILSSMINRILDTSWVNIDAQLITDFRNQILDLFFNNELSNDLSTQIEIIIANIAFNQWPEVWPNFIGELLSIVDEIENIDNVTKIFHILTNLVTSFSTSQFISLARRNLLIQELQFKIPDIISLIQSIPFEEVCQNGVGQSFINFVQLYCKLNLDDTQICYDLAEYLLTAFTTTIPSTFTALKSLISKERIDADFFNLSIENILELIDKSQSDLKELISFICHIIKESISIIPNFCSDANFLVTIRNILEFTLLNGSKTDFWEDIWSLWSLLLNNYAEDIELRTSAVCLILEPMLQTVLDSLFEYLPTAMSQSRLISFQPISCIVAFTMIDEDNLLTYLSEKDLSSSLLISLGIIYFLDDNELFESTLNEVIPPLLSDHFADDINTSLFVLSRNTPYLSTHLDVLEEVVGIFTELASSDEYPIVQSFLLALNHVASKIPDVITKQCPDFIMFLLENLVDPAKLQKDEFLRICRIMSKFVASTDTVEDQQRLSEILTTPVNQLLTDEDDQENVQLGCEAVNSLASISQITVGVTMEFLWDSLLVALNNFRDSEIFSIVCDSFATTIRTCSFQKCFQVVSSFVEFAETVTNQDCAIVHTFSQIRLCHREMDTYRQTIADTYIQNMVNEETITFEFFEFFEAFDIFEDEQSIVVPIACDAIRCYDSRISKSAANLLLKHFRAEIVPFKIPCECDIIMAVFDALFDQVHHQCMKKLIELLHLVVDVMHKREIPFEQCIFDAIQNKICDDEFSQKIVTALKNSVAQNKMFTDFVTDMLISAGRANPNEFQMLSDVVCTRTKSMPRSPFQNEDEIGKC